MTSPSSSIIIRPARIDDALAISAIQRAGLREVYAGIIPEDTFATVPPFTQLSGWQRLLHNPDEHDQLLVAEEPDGTIVGYVRAGENVEEDDLTYPGEIIAFHVLDSEAHTPAAQALLETVLTRLADQALLPAVTTTPASSPLRALFEQLGGRAIGQEDIWVQGVRHQRLRYGFGEGVAGS